VSSPFERTLDRACATGNTYEAGERLQGGVVERKAEVRTLKGLVPLIEKFPWCNNLELQSLPIRIVDLEQVEVIRNQEFGFAETAAAMNTLSSGSRL